MRGHAIAGRELAKEILLEILRRSGGEICGETRLHEVFYLAHICHFQRHGRLLSDWPIVRAPHGPGIGQADELIGALAEEGKMAVETAADGPRRELRLRLRRVGDSKLDAEEKAAILEATKHIRGETAATLIGLPERSRSWREGGDGEELNIYLDAIPDDELGRRRRALSEIADIVSSAWRDELAFRP